MAIGDYPPFRHTTLMVTTPPAPVAYVPPPPPPPTVSTGKCPLCTAMVEWQDKDHHLTWHRVNGLHGPDCHWLLNEIAQASEIQLYPNFEETPACKCWPVDDKEGTPA